MAASPPHSPSNRKWGAAKLGKLIYDAMGEVDEFLGDKFTEEQKDWAKDFVRDLYFAVDVGQELRKLPRHEEMPGPNGKGFFSMVEVLERLTRLSFQIPDDVDLQTPRVGGEVSAKPDARVPAQSNVATQKESTADGGQKQMILSPLRANTNAFQPTTFAGVVLQGPCGFCGHFSHHISLCPTSRCRICHEQGHMTFRCPMAPGANPPAHFMSTPLAFGPPGNNFGNGNFQGASLGFPQLGGYAFLPSPSPSFQQPVIINRGSYHGAGNMSRSVRAGTTPIDHLGYPIVPVPSNRISKNEPAKVLSVGEKCKEKKIEDPISQTAAKKTKDDKKVENLLNQVAKPNPSWDDYTSAMNTFLDKRRLQEKKSAENFAAPSLQIDQLAGGRTKEEEKAEESVGPPPVSNPQKKDALSENVAPAVKAMLLREKEPTAKASTMSPGPQENKSGELFSKFDPMKILKAQGYKEGEGLGPAGAGMISLVQAAAVRKGKNKNAGLGIVQKVPTKNQNLSSSTSMSRSTIPAASKFLPPDTRDFHGGAGAEHLANVLKACWPVFKEVLQEKQRQKQPITQQAKKTAVPPMSTASMSLVTAGPSATATTGRDVNKPFNPFTLPQHTQVKAERSQSLEKNREVKLDNLKKFSTDFKLHLVVPDDLIPVITKDPAKQESLQKSNALISSGLKSTLSVTAPQGWDAIPTVPEVENWWEVSKDGKGDKAVELSKDPDIINYGRWGPRTSVQAHRNRWPARSSASTINRHIQEEHLPGRNSESLQKLETIPAIPKLENKSDVRKDDEGDNDERDKAAELSKGRQPALNDIWGERSMQEHRISTLFKNAYPSSSSNSEPGSPPEPAPLPKTTEDIAAAIRGLLVSGDTVKKELNPYRNPPKPAACRKCNRLFPTSGAVHRHIREEHSPPKSRRRKQVQTNSPLSKATAGIDAPTRGLWESDATEDVTVKEKLAPATPQEVLGAVVRGPLNMAAVEDDAVKKEKSRTEDVFVKKGVLNAKNPGLKILEYKLQEDVVAEVGGRTNRESRTEYATKHQAATPNAYKKGLTKLGLLSSVLPASKVSQEQRLVAEPDPYRRALMKYGLLSDESPSKKTPQQPSTSFFDSSIDPFTMLSKKTSTQSTLPNLFKGQSGDLDKDKENVPLRNNASSGTILSNEKLTMTSPLKVQVKVEPLSEVENSMFEQDDLIAWD